MRNSQKADRTDYYAAYHRRRYDLDEAYGERRRARAQAHMAKQRTGVNTGVNKAALIRSLLAGADLSRAQIAERAGCSQEYVRAVEQRCGRPGGMSPSDVRWRQDNRDKMRAYARKSAAKVRARRRAQAQARARAQA